MHRAAVAVRAPFELPVELRHDPLGLRSLGERMPVRAMRGADHVVALERGADADRGPLSVSSETPDQGFSSTLAISGNYADGPVGWVEACRIASRAAATARVSSGAIGAGRASATAA